MAGFFARRRRHATQAEHADFPLNPDGSVIHASHLALSSLHGPVFGPLDLKLCPGDLCVVYGTTGSGKSALLLALTGRMRGVTGHLRIVGKEAIPDPYAALRYTSVGRVGQYVAPDDRLTISELIAERAYLDGSMPAATEQQAERIEEWLGYRVDRVAQYQELPAIEKTVVCAALGLVVPSAITVVDDADADVPMDDLVPLYAALKKLAQLNGSVIVVSASNATGVPQGTVRVHLPARTVSRLYPVEDSPADISVASEPPEPIEVPDVSDTEVTVTRATTAASAGKHQDGVDREER